MTEVLEPTLKVALLGLKLKEPDVPLPETVTLMFAQCRSEVQTRTVAKPLPLPVRFKTVPFM